MSSRKRSEIWNFFTDLGDSKAKCNFCFRQLSYKSGSTFNLARHVRTLHPGKVLSVERLTPASVLSEENEDDPRISVATSGTDRGATTQQTRAAVTTTTKQCSQTSLGAYFHKPLSVGKNQEIDYLLLETIVENYLPFQFVESLKFRKLLNKLNSAYKMPTRKTLSTVILPQVYNLTKNAVQEQLQSAEFVTLTTDGWTSIRNESYISVTAHFIRDQHMQSYLLECYKYDAKHTAQNLADELKRVSRAWGLTEKIVCVVSDNAANIVAAIRLTGWRHIPCFAHNLNLIVRSGLQCITTITAKVKTIVEFFKRSTQATTKLKEMQETMNLPVLSVKQDVVTRWNSTFDMLQRILDIQRSLIATIALNYPELPQLTNDDVEKIRKICDLLKVFRLMTEEMCSEKQVTSSKVILLSATLKRWCASFLHNTDKSHETDEVRQMAEKMLEALNSRFRGIEENEVFAEATFVDPRFKSHGFQDNRCFEKTKQRVISFCKAHQPATTSSSEDVPPQQELSEVESIVWGAFDRSISVFIKNPHPTSAAIIEVDKYIQEPILPRKENPLVWWFQRAQVYPSLFNLAKRRLCVVATSTPSERVFSKAGQTITERRSRLTGKRVEEILFLNANLSD